MEVCKLSKEISTQNTRETDKKMNSAILKALATTELSHIAPLLSLARAVDSKSNVGLTYSTCVDAVEMKEMRAYVVLRIVISTVTSNAEFNQKSVSVLYTFRMITQSTFEPFVYISKNKEMRSVFAYIDEDEFLFSNVKGTEDAVLEKTYLEAIELDKKVLARYIDLIRTGFNKGKPLEAVNDAK